jgi:hypothetical protein
MERKHAIIQWIREVVGNRTERLLEVVRGDREQMHRGEQPAHVRALFRAAAAGGEESRLGVAPAAVGELQFARAAAEPDPQQQSVAIEQLLDAGVWALESLVQQERPELSAEQALGLEYVALEYVRPMLPINREGQMAATPGCWTALVEERAAIERVQRSVGQIELLGHPEYEWAGTGFLVGPQFFVVLHGIPGKA